MVGSMRAVVKCAALMSQGGVIDGVRVIKQSTVKLALSDPITSHDKFLQYSTAFTKGGFYVLGQFDNGEDIPEQRIYG